MRSTLISIMFTVISLTALSQNNKTFLFHNYIFSTDSIAGFDEMAARSAALSEGYLGEEFKVKMWQYKRAYVNAKYGIQTAKTVNLPVNPVMIVPACTNEDFEGSVPANVTTSAQINGWTISEGFGMNGFNSCNLPPMTNSPTECHLIDCSVTGTVDPVIGGCYPVYSVFGGVANLGNSINPSLAQMKGDKVIRINTNGSWSPNNYSITKLSKTYAVTAASSLFQFAFIAVMSTGHTCCSAGGFQIQLTNATANTIIACPNYSISSPGPQCVATNTAVQFYNAGGSCTPFTGTGTYIFNKWHVSSFDLSAYIGQNITIDILASDCDASGHFAYSYIDAQCSPMEFISNGNSFPASSGNVTVSTCGTGPSTITAPAGLGPYSWSSSQISVSANYAVPSMTNNVFVTNQTGTVLATMNPAGACSPINQTVTIVNVPSGNILSISGNSIQCGNGSTTLTASGASSYSWSTGATTNSIVVSPGSVTTYSVTDGIANPCSIGANFTVTPFSQPTLTILGTPSVCIGTSSTFTLLGASSFSMNSVTCPSTINLQPIITTNYVFLASNGTVCNDSQTLNLVVNQGCTDVWPGDANSDGIANNLDVLEIGLHYGQSGPPRSFTSTNWQGYYSNNWMGTISNGKNLNHSDCNGDGLIDASDALAVAVNYNNTHSFKTNSSNAGEQITIVPDQNFVSSGQWGTASVYLGNVITQVNSINGLAFSVSYDNMYIQPDSVYMTYPVSFLNSSGENLNFSKNYFSNGKIHCATTHTTNTNVNGNGAVAVFHFKVHPALMYDTIFRFEVQLVNKSEVSGIITPLISGPDTSTHIGISLGIKPAHKEINFEIFPNPSKGSLTINCSKEIQRIEVVNITGQILISEIGKGNSHQMKAESLANGIYFIKVYSSDNTVSVKKVIFRK